MKRNKKVREDQDNRHFNQTGTQLTLRGQISTQFDQNTSCYWNVASFRWAVKAFNCIFLLSVCISEWLVPESVFSASGFLKVYLHSAQRGLRSKITYTKLYNKQIQHLPSHSLVSESLSFHPQQKVKGFQALSCTVLHSLETTSRDPGQRKQMLLFVKKSGQKD